MAFMSAKQAHDQFSEQEAQRRFEASLRGAFRSPSKPKGKRDRAAKKRPATRVSKNRR